MIERKTLAGAPALQRPLRLWPGVVAVTVQWLIWFIVPIAMPGASGGYLAALGGILAAVPIVVWWVFFSRAPRAERWGAIVLMVVVLAVTRALLHESMATAGFGMVFFIYAVPVLSLALVGWALVSRDFSEGRRRTTLVATILLTCTVWTLVRTDGVRGNADMDFAWRWAPTAEEQLLAHGGDEPVGLSARAAADTGADWPGFRRPGRDGIVRGVRIETDWSRSPPVELWRRPVGPGWSSFALRGNLVFTQEQRGDDEVVSSYHVTTGEPVWRHGDPTRFWEANAGAGPRGTLPLDAGRVYTFGATGILNVLDAADGTLVWSRNVSADTETEVPESGFASSPLVIDDLVIVAVEGVLAAYDRATGDRRWLGPDGGYSYSSPHLVTIDEVEQVLLMSGVGATSISPADGTLLWEHGFRRPAERIVQPALPAGGDVLISAGGGTGIRRIAVAQGPGGWTTDERWTSNRLKPYFSDFVVHEGHAYGFDGNILASIDVEDGARKWKGGRYGSGQLVLLPDQDLLLVLSEQGEAALVAALPDQFTELARFPAIVGKTWNHPVLVGDLLLVRNDQEMVAFRLPLVGR